MEGEGGETEAALTKEKRRYQEADDQYERALARVKKAEDALEKWEAEHPGFDIENQTYLRLQEFLEKAQKGFGIATHALEVAERQWKEAEPKSPPITKEPFFTQVGMAELVNDMLTFRYLIPLTDRNELYIRNAYKVIYDLGVSSKVAMRRKYVAVTGTPGIGKSAFLYYVFWRIVKEKMRVFFVTQSIYFDGETMRKLKEMPDSESSFWETDLWCLVDSADPITTLGQFNVLKCSVLLATIPRKDYLKEFKKLVPTPQMFYMPLWSRDELQSIAGLYTNVNAWEKRFVALGGIPRYVLEDVSLQPEQLLRAACTECSLDDVIKIVSVDVMLTNKTKVVQNLVHVHSENPYSRDDAEVRYASQTAVKIIVQTYSRQCSQQVKTLLASSQEGSLAGALRGYMFQKYAIKELHKGGTFSCRELVAGRARKKRKTRITIPPSREPVKIVDVVATDQQTKQLYIPKTSNLASINAWMPGFGAFQITVAKTHDLEDRVTDDMAKL
mgnify:FL=1